jgi:MOSC domain-containing protein YiiM
VKLISINAGLPKEVRWDGKTVKTSIWKAPVAGRVRVRTLNIEGDRQSDLTVHGGPLKAVYVYPSEHYAYWRGKFPDVGLTWGAFGENFTTEGLTEDSVRIGDRLRIGSAEFAVTQPRLPCYKLGIRFGRPAMVKMFMKSRLTGFYLAVTGEGEAGADDPVEILARAEGGFSVTDIVRMYSAGAKDREELRRAAGLVALPESWRDYFRKQIA